MTIAKDEIAATAKEIVRDAIDGRMQQLLNEDHDWRFGEDPLCDSQRKELRRCIERHLVELSNFLK